jgi:hypothetical protein
VPDFTTTALVAGVKRRGFLSGGSGLSSGEILQYASDELRTGIPAFLKSIREEYIIASVDIAVSSALVDVPARAVGAALRTIGMLQTDGRVLSLDRIEPENADGLTGQTGTPTGYVFRGNQVELLPAPTSGTLRLTYQQRPGQLVLPSACARVTGTDDSFTLTVASVPSTMTAGVLCDLVSGTPNFVASALDLEIVAVTTTTIEFTSIIDTLFSVGDFVCLAGETCIPQVPTEVHDLLAQATAAAVADAQGSQRLDSINKKLEKLREETRLILSPRSDGSARPVVSRSRVGRSWWGW